MSIWNERAYWLGRLYPVFFGIGSAYAFYRFYILFDSPNNLMDKVVNSALVVCGTLLGFLLTITTILNAIDTRRMRFIKDQGGYPLLMNYLRSAIVLNIVTVSTVIVTPLIYAIEEMTPAIKYCHTAQVFIIVWSWVASIRFTVVFVRLLSDN